MKFGDSVRSFEVSGVLDTVGLFINLLREPVIRGEINGFDPAFTKLKSVLHCRGVGDCKECKVSVNIVDIGIGIVKVDEIF